jgi:pimeloyl-ACP methyl ester carboxylesterase
VRGIAISLPGYGYTDMKPGRKVLDWANEDLLAVLDQEGVDEFMITGHSQGTALLLGRSQD